MTSGMTGVDVRLTDTGSAAVVDLSCGRCAPCLADADLWCAQPRAHGDVLLEVPAHQDKTATRALLLADAVRCAEPADEQTVLMLGGEVAVAAAALVRLLHGGTVLVAREARDPDVLAALEAARPSGRADVVGCYRDDRAAVRAVSRGGDVCLALQDAAATTVTELVQREVRLIGPRSLTALLAVLGRPAAELALART